MSLSVLRLYNREDLPMDIENVKVDLRWVADLLEEMFGDRCACNYNDIDEWLPDTCSETDRCPQGDCWMQFVAAKYKEGVI